MPVYNCEQCIEKDNRKMKLNNEKDLTFSVLMSVYYKEKPDYLRLSLDSIVNQTLLPTEIVLVKDGQLTEELDQVISNFSNDYPRLFVIIPLEKNVGLGRALNVGLNKCKYELVARMDSDDIAVLDRFEVQLNEFKKDKDLAMCGGWIQEFDGDVKDVISYRKVPLDSVNIRRYAKHRNPFNHMTVIFKKKAVLDSGSYQDMPYFEDYWLWIRMISKGFHTCNVGKIVVYARTGISMISRRGGIAYAKNCLIFALTLRKHKFLNKFEFLSLAIGRCFVAILPNVIRTKIYISFLR